MMLHLYLLRHAKSSLATPGQRDFDRPLNERGQGAAQVMGQYLSRCTPRPSHILCSSSRRTRETLAGILHHLFHDLTISLSRKLYDGDAQALIGIIRQAPHCDLLIIGHNPAMEALATLLARDGAPEPLEKLAEKYPTCALASLRFDLSTWQDLAEHSGYLADFTVPQDLNGDKVA